MIYCRNCGKEMNESADFCIHCGADQMVPRVGGKNKIVAGLLAIFVGSFGIHRFYLGQWWGIFYLLFFWTLVPLFISFIEGIVFFLTNDAIWNKKYGITRKKDNYNFIESLDKLYKGGHMHAPPPQHSPEDDDK